MHRAGARQRHCVRRRRRRGRVRPGGQRGEQQRGGAGAVCDARVRQGARRNPAGARGERRCAASAAGFAGYSLLRCYFAMRAFVKALDVHPLAVTQNAGALPVAFKYGNIIYLFADMHFAGGGSCAGVAV